MYGTQTVVNDSCFITLRTTNLIAKLYDAYTYCSFMILFENEHETYQNSKLVGRRAGEEILLCVNQMIHVKMSKL